MLDYIQRNFDEIKDKEIKITSENIRTKYKLYCDNMGIKYNLNTLNTQIKKIGINEPTQLRFKIDGESVKKYCYKINLNTLQTDMRQFLQDDTYILKTGADDNVEYEKDGVIGLNYNEDKEDFFNLM